MKTILFTTILLLSFIAPAQDCLDFSQYNQQYLDSLNSASPGTIAFTQGNLSFVKGDVPCYFFGIQGDTLMYMGKFQLDASAANCPNKQLTFSCVYLEGLAIDGDTVFTSLNPPGSYTGNGFTFEYMDYGNYKQYTITGDFDIVDLFTQTNFIWDVCLECLPNVISSSCIDFSQYNQQYLDSVNFEPAGTTVFTAGNLSIIKGEIPCYFLNVQGDTLTYMGNLMLDASAETCQSKRLSFKCMYLEGLAVDGDTIFTSLNPPASYSGSGFTFEYFNYNNYREYIITGDFDVVDLFTQTNIIWDVCLECLAQTESIQKMINLSIYPNPVVDGKLTLESDQAAQYLIYDVNGQLMNSGKMQTNITLDVSNLRTGMYLIKVLDANGYALTQRIIVN